VAQQRSGQKRGDQDKGFEWEDSDTPGDRTSGDDDDYRVGVPYRIAALCGSHSDPHANQDRQAFRQPHSQSVPDSDGHGNAGGHVCTYRDADGPGSARGHAYTYDGAADVYGTTANGHSHAQAS